MAASRTSRARDRIADRLRALAAWAERAAAKTQLAASTVDGASLRALADAQREAEIDLARRSKEYADACDAYADDTRERESFLLSAIEAFEREHRDKHARRALRLCKLRRPPLAKVEAVIGLTDVSPMVAARL